LRTLVEEVDRSEIVKSLPSYLQYACRYWFDHLHQLDNRQREKSDLCDNRRVYKFLHQRFLHWLEALSLMGKMSEGALMITTLQSILAVSSFMLLRYDLRR
jgi:hypothetical protein